MVTNGQEPTRKDRGGKPIAGEDFIDYWQKSNTVLSVADHFNISYAMATRWAYEYRKLGVPLKRMRWTGDKRWTEYGKKGGVPTHKSNRVRRPRGER